MDVNVKAQNKEHVFFSSPAFSWDEGLAGSCSLDLMFLMFVFLHSTSDLIPYLDAALELIQLCLIFFI